ncbi:MAG: flagellar basal body-associated FliL family protein [Phycisphaerales bacterium]|nr:MAG: flagellar basal body-associated FliL family protein [Phycisphaerales bacterium]
MADTAKKELHEDADAEGSNDKVLQSRDRRTVGSILPWIITLVVAVLCAGAGLTLGRLFAASRTPGQTEHCPENPLLELQSPEEARPPTDSERTWYYDLEPVTVNLNEPAIRHHVRASVTLEMSGGVDPSKGRAFLERRKVLLADRLTVHLASLAPQDLRGEGKIEQVQLQIRDIFNKELFPHSKPRIKQVLLKHLAMQ